ncbi:protein of unknown function [Cupriavidus neocaledonicus]|uniref:Uncharacterized protein n=1 Tax=Cupriavidus neocaledonicus TaxID=1040979 RepID=A0A375HCX8_9BURK|nr:hypothetical protein CBM2605_A240085 [Cupriavidus neocaledonicus]SPD48080.1 protein of unknown function [Cupriavidus neocaledonicus]
MKFGSIVTRGNDDIRRFQIPMSE